jgi:hypothetical protein
VEKGELAESRIFVYYSIDFEARVKGLLNPSNRCMYMCAGEDEADF